MGIWAWRRTATKVAVVAMTLAATQTVAQPAATGQTYRCGGEIATIVGTNASETIRGTSGDDVIVGRGGDDRIFGRGGDDIICGNRGDDFVKAGSGNDIVYGGKGSDDLRGGKGNDVLRGNTGPDTLRGQSGRDRLHGNTNTDILRGGSGADDLFGGKGRDVLIGDKGRGADGEGDRRSTGPWDFCVGGTGRDEYRRCEGFIARPSGGVTPTVDVSLTLEKDTTGAGFFGDNWAFDGRYLWEWDILDDLLTVVDTSTGATTSYDADALFGDDFTDVTLMEFTYGNGAFYTKFSGWQGTDLATYVARFQGASPPASYTLVHDVPGPGPTWCCTEARIIAGDTQVAIIGWAHLAGIYNLGSDGSPGTSFEWVTGASDVVWIGDDVWFTSHWTVSGVARDGLWRGTPSSGSLTRVLPGDRDNIWWELAVGPSGLWVGSANGDLLLVDPATGQVDHTWTTGSGSSVTDIVEHDGMLFASDVVQTTVFDVATGEVIGAFREATNSGGLVVANDHLWILDPQGARQVPLGQFR